MQGEKTVRRRRPGATSTFVPASLSTSALSLLALLLGLGAGAARAEAGDTTASMEVSAGRDFRALSLLGDVELREGTTFLTLGYTGARPEAGTAAAHQLSVGADHLLGDHWLLSGAVSVGLPRTSVTELSPERPLLRLPGVSARTGSASQGLLLSAGYDSAGLGDVEYGLDASLGVTRYPLRRQLLTVTASGPEVQFAREDLLWVARPTLGARLLLGGRWELGLRAALTLYSEDPLDAGQFTEAEQTALERRFESAVAARRSLLGLRTRQLRDLGTVVSRRLEDLNATTGFPAAPPRFDLKPSVTWRLSSAVRGQVSYAFTRYVPGEGLSHVLATRWTVRLGKAARVWASVALQSDHLEETGGETSGPERSGLFTLGGEYTF